MAEVCSLPPNLSRISVLKLLRPRGQLGNLEIERGGNPPDAPPGWVVAARLKVGNPGRMDSGSVAQRLLAEAAFFPELLDRSSQAYLRFGAGPMKDQTLPASAA